MQKNTAAKWIVFAFQDEGGTNPGEPVTGDAANITANVHIDGGAANAVDDTNPAELAGGYYVFDITATENNGDLIAIIASSSTANVNVIGVPGALYTTPANFPALGIEVDGDLTKVNTLNGHTAQTGDNFARLGAPAGASVSADIATVDGNVDTLLTRITSTLFSGITSLAEWLGMLAGKQAGDATALTEIKATGAGSGTFDPTTDSGEALRDHVGDGTNLTEAGGTGDHLTAINLPNQTMDITGDIAGNLSGSVGSVTGNVGGNVTGSVGSVTGAINTAAGTITTLDGLDTAQDTQHAATKTVVDNLNLGIIYGAAATGTLSTTQATTDLTGYADDQLIGRHITVTSGAAEGEQTDITDSANTGGLLTFTALTTAMADGDTFKIT